jgi:osmotically-inducible protein OsmY
VYQSHYRIARGACHATKLIQLNERIGLFHARSSRFSGTEAVMDDLVLRNHILNELEFEPSISAEQIGVAVRDGVVTLTGHVSSYFEKIAAESAVRRVKGVRAIAQDIIIRRPEDKKWSDSEIAERAVKIISWHSEIPDGAVMVKVDNGWITLSGDVKVHTQKVAAEAAVRKLSGVVGISNFITVKAGPTAPDTQRRIERALSRHASVKASAIHVGVSDGRVVLSGTADTLRDRDTVERAAWAVPGVTAVENRVTVR